MHPIVMWCSGDAKWVASDGNGNVKKVLAAVEKSVSVYFRIHVCICDMRQTRPGPESFAVSSDYCQWRHPIEEEEMEMALIDFLYEIWACA